LLASYSLKYGILGILGTILTVKQIKMLQSYHLHVLSHTA
jgi:hypothetical protein